MVSDDSDLSEESILILTNAGSYHPQTRRRVAHMIFINDPLFTNQGKDI